MSQHLGLNVFFARSTVGLAKHVPEEQRTNANVRRVLRGIPLTQLWELAGYYEPDEHGRRPPESLYGSLKMWAHLRRQGIEVARCTMERLMRANGWQGTRQVAKQLAEAPTSLRSAGRFGEGAPEAFAFLPFLPALLSAAAGAGGTRGSTLLAW